MQNREPRSKWTAEEIRALLAGYTPATKPVTREDFMPKRTPGGQIYIPRTWLIDTGPGGTLNKKELFSNSLRTWDEQRRGSDRFKKLNKEPISYPEIFYINKEISYNKDVDPVRPERQLPPEAVQALIVWARSRRAKTA